MTLGICLPQPCFFKTGSHCVEQAGLGLACVEQASLGLAAAFLPPQLLGQACTTIPGFALGLS